MTPAFSTGLPVVAFVTVTVILQVGGGGVYLRPRLVVSCAETARGMQRERTRTLRKTTETIAQLYSSMPNKETAWSRDAKEKEAVKTSFLAISFDYFNSLPRASRNPVRMLNGSDGYPIGPMC